MSLRPVCARISCSRTSTIPSQIRISLLVVPTRSLSLRNYCSDSVSSMHWYRRDESSDHKDGTSLTASMSRISGSLSGSYRLDFLFDDEILKITFSVRPSISWNLHDHHGFSMTSQIFYMEMGNFEY